MGQINSIIDYAVTKLRGICEESTGKPVPNWFKVEDMQGFGLHVNEGELNFQIVTVIYPVEEMGPGNFLIKLQASFMGSPVVRNGYTFIGSPLGAAIELDCAIYAEDEQALQDGVLQFISEEAENILCQILQ